MPLVDPDDASRVSTGTDDLLHSVAHRAHRVVRQGLAQVQVIHDDVHVAHPSPWPPAHGGLPEHRAFPGASSPFGSLPSAA